MARTIFPILPNLLPKSDPRYQKWLTSLKKRPPPWNKNHTKYTHKSVLKISKTFKEREIDNFLTWREGAKAKGFIQSSYPTFERNSNLAFLIGLILGDGNLYKFPRTECLRIVLGTDKPDLIVYTNAIMTKVIGKTPSISRRKSAECVDLRIYQKNLGRRLSIPIGARGKLTIKLPIWIWRNNKFLTLCLKGLFEAEGYFSVHMPSSTYNLAFVNYNISLLDEVEKALVTLGFHPERRINAVRLRKKKEALAFVELIQFRKYNSI